MALNFGLTSLFFFIFFRAWKILKAVHYMYDNIAGCGLYLVELNSDSVGDVAPNSANLK